MKSDKPKSVFPSAFTVQTDNSELAVLAAGGNADAFALIMRRHNKLLFRTARSILKDDTDTEDAVQESYLNAWNGLHTFRSEAKLSTWLVRIVINESLGRLRRKGGQVIPLDAAVAVDLDQSPQSVSIDQNPNGQPEQSAMRAQLRRIIEARIDTLPDAFRTVFMLRAVEEMSVEEVAEALDIPEATVRSRFFRARGLLREGLSRDVDFAIEDAFSFAGARCDRIVRLVINRIFPGGNGPARA